MPRAMAPAAYTGLDSGYKILLAPWVGAVLVWVDCVTVGGLCGCVTVCGLCLLCDCGWTV